MFCCCVVDWTKLDSNDASIFGMRIVRDLLDYIGIFVKNGLVVVIAGFGYVLIAGKTLSKWP